MLRPPLHATYIYHYQRDVGGTRCQHVGVWASTLQTADVVLGQQRAKHRFLIHKHLHVFELFPSQRKVGQLAAKSSVFSIRHAWRHCLHVAANTCGWYRTPQPRHGFLRIGVPRQEFHNAILLFYNLWVVVCLLHPQLRLLPAHAPCFVVVPSLAGQHPTKHLLKSCTKTSMSSRQWAHNSRQRLCMV